MTTLEKIKLEIASHFLWDGEVKTDIPYTVQACLDIIDKYAEQGPNVIILTQKEYSDLCIQLKGLGWKFVQEPTDKSTLEKICEELAAENDDLRDRLQKQEPSIEKLKDKLHDKIEIYVCEVEENTLIAQGMLKALGMMDEVLDNAEQEPKWIPISEGLPKPYEQVLRAVKSFGWNSTLHIHVDIGTICPIDTDVIAWMPLPEPYKEESKSERW